MGNGPQEKVSLESFESLSEVVGFIQEKIDRGVSSEDMPEFIRDPKVKPFTEEDLFELLRLSVEVGLTEENGKIVLTVGDTHSVTGGGEAYLDRESNSKLSLHTHVSTKRTVGKLSISFGDVWRVNFRKEGGLFILLHADGLTVYGNATVDPSTGETLGKEPDHRDLMEKYVRKYGYSLHGVKAFKDFSSLSIEKQLLISNEFAEKSEMIRKKVSWGDKEGVKSILDMVNLINQETY